jgi:hypothetical protein
MTSRTDSYRRGSERLRTDVLSGAGSGSGHRVEPDGGVHPKCRSLRRLPLPGVLLTPNKMLRHGPLMRFSGGPRGPRGSKDKKRPPLWGGPSLGRKRPRRAATPIRYSRCCTAQFGCVQSDFKRVGRCRAGIAQVGVPQVCAEQVRPAQLGPKEAVARLDADKVVAVKAGRAPRTATSPG